MGRMKQAVMSPAYLREDEPGFFHLYRDVAIRWTDEETHEALGYDVVGSVGPLAVFREARSEEPVDLRTVHPGTKRPLSLRRVWDAARDGGSAPGLSRAR